MNYKDLSKVQLEALKTIYIESRVEGMSEKELRQFVKEVLELQIRGTVGNAEEREVWREMKDHFDENFEQKVKEVIKAKGLGDKSISLEQTEFQKRLEVLEQRKKEESNKNKDMW